MSPISTHILDISIGRPAKGVPVKLEFLSNNGWIIAGQDSTDSDGRVRELLKSDFAFAAGTYRLTFDTRAYFNVQNVESFYPEVTVTFEVKDKSQHYHVPLLLSPFGYSTYRGS